MKYHQNDQPFHVLIVTIILVVNFSCVLCQTTVKPTTSSTPPPAPLPPLPTPPPACQGGKVGKDVWNICWMNSPPYVFSNDLHNTTKIEGILVEVLNEGFKICNCSKKTKYHRVDTVEELIECSRSENTDIALPFPRKKAALPNWIFSVVDSPNIYLLLNRESIESKAKERVLQEFMSVWTIAVLTVLLAFIFGIIVWFLDMFWNTEQFPPMFIPGSLEGVWWSFVTLTTVGYGDKIPRFPLARMFAVIWMFVGMGMISLLTATMTKTLTTAVFDKQNYLPSKTIGVLNDSYTYDEAVKKGAQPAVFSDLYTMYKALDDPQNGKLDGILIDIFVATYVLNNPKRYPLTSKLFVGESYDVVYPLSFYLARGITMVPYMQFRECFSQTYRSTSNNIDVYRIVEKYITSVGDSRSIKQSQIQLEMNLFSSEEATFLIGMKTLSGILGALIFLGIIWQILHWKRFKSKNIASGTRKDRNDLEAINMTPHHHRDPPGNLKSLMDKLNEVDDALNKLTEFRELLETYKKDAKRYDSGIVNGVSQNGSTNLAYS